MQDEDKEKTINLYADEIDLRQLFSFIWDKKKIIFAITTIVAISSVFYALSLPNTYTSRALLAPADSDDSLTSKLSGLTSLGGFAGIGVVPPTLVKSKEGIARINSFDFFTNNFLPNVKLENIIATEDWDPVENKLSYNERIFDSSKQKWIREADFPRSIVPSNQEAYEIFQTKLTVIENLETSFITISIDHHSPIIAKRWVNIIVKEINESMRKIDADLAEKSIIYLNEKASTTNIQSIQDAIAKLLETQMQTLMLTYANEDYVYKIIEPPVAPEFKSGPNRALICIVLTFLGGMLSLSIVLIQYLRKIQREVT